MRQRGADASTTSSARSSRRRRHHGPRRRLRAPAAPGRIRFATLHDDSAAMRDIARFRPVLRQGARRGDRAHDGDSGTADSGDANDERSTRCIGRRWSGTDGMSDMNWLATGKEVRWIIRDKRTGAENMNVALALQAGDVVKVRVFNDPRSFHPMNHPLHLHGQRFLVVARDGQAKPVSGRGRTPPSSRSARRSISGRSVESRHVDAALPHRRARRIGHDGAASRSLPTEPPHANARKHHQATRRRRARMM